MPQYRIQDTLTGKVHIFEGPYNTPPTDDEIEDKVFGTITRPSPIREKLGEIKRVITEPVSEEMRPLFGQQSTEAQANVPLNWALRQMDRPVAALRSAAAGKSPVEGFVKPETAPPFGETILSRVHTGDDKTDVLISAIGGAILDVGSYGLVYGALPRAISKGYGGLQSKGVERLKNNLRFEFESMGMSPVEAKTATDLFVAKKWNDLNVLERSPVGLNSTNKVLEANKGALGKQIKVYSEVAKAKAAQQGFTEEWFRKAGTVAPTLETGITTEPLRLEYKGVPQSVVKDLPSEVIPPPTQQEVVKTLSRFPQKVVDQKSLEEVGNAMAKEMGIVKPLKWRFVSSSTDYLSAQQEGEDTIVLRVPQNYPTKERRAQYATRVIRGRS
jgi:hypothetical protein